MDADNFDKAIIDRRTDFACKISYSIADLMSKIPIRGTLLLGQLAGRVLLGKPSAPTIIRSIYGYDMLVFPHVDEGVDRTLFLTGTIERGALNIIRQFISSFPKAIFFDIGANIGMVTIFASKLLTSGKVYSFEPVSNALQRLAFNIRLNNAGNVKVFNFALGAKEEYRDIYVNPSHLGMSSFLKETIPGTPCKVVKVRTIDNIMKDLGSNADFIKIDVEGWESEVLKGAPNLLRSNGAPAIMFEYCPARSDSHEDKTEIFNCLKMANDYRFFILNNGDHRISRLSEIDSNNLPTFANVFCFLPEHLRRMPDRLFWRSGI